MRRLILGFTIAAMMAAPATAGCHSRGHARGQWHAHWQARPTGYRYVETYRGPACAAPCGPAVAPPTFAPPLPQIAPQPAVGGPLGLLNTLRARHGLSAVAWDANLAASAAQNNSAQAQRGLGHHVTAGCWQCAGWNYASPDAAMQGWYASPGHRAAILNPGVRVAGLAIDGQYATINLR